MTGGVPLFQETAICSSLFSFILLPGDRAGHVAAKRCPTQRLCSVPAATSPQNMQPRCRSSGTCPSDASMICASASKNLPDLGGCHCLGLDPIRVSRCCFHEGTWLVGRRFSLLLKEPQLISANYTSSYGGVLKWGYPQMVDL